METPQPDPILTGEVDVRIEVPRGAFLKRRADGRVDFLSPLPCPYNYGSIPKMQGWDGEALDAVVLGPTLGRGACTTTHPRGVIRFVDAGQWDPKVICSDRPLSRLDTLGLLSFFRFYAFGKRALARLRRVPSAETRCLGYQSSDPG